MTTSYAPAPRSHLVGGLLGIFLGGLGIHKFYNGKIAQGLVYLVFAWTFIPAIVGFIEGIWYLSMSDETYADRYPRSASSGSTTGAWLATDRKASEY